MNRPTAIKLLQHVGMAEAADEVLDVNVIAAELDQDPQGVAHALEQLELMGLILQGIPESPTPMLRTAGSQFLDRGGRVDRAVLHFLPRVIDDLDTREALIHAGVVMVDELRAAILEGRGAELARELVPPAFAAAADDRLALRLHAAAVALMARLSCDTPAGCVAEEIMSVALMEEAKVRLEMRADEGEIEPERMRAASSELRGLFELFEDDDVLNLFDMAEPADAAVAVHDPINRQMGVVDQRVEAWFEPFGGVTPTGHLDSVEPEIPDDEDQFP